MAWANVAFSQRGDGDMGHAGRYVLVADEEVESRRRAAVDRPWTWLRQVHGTSVVTVRRPGGCAGTVADASVSAEPGCALAILTADCAPVALASPEGVVGAVHAGWAGLAAGVVASTVTGMRSLGATEVRAVIGPCIRPRCYEFGPSDLEPLVERFGPAARGETSWGTPALDLPAAVSVELTEAGVHAVDDIGACTACDTTWFSWRARRELQRQAMVVTR